MILRVHHRTAYAYPSPASESHNEARLRPLDDAWQTRREFTLRVQPSVPALSFEEPGGTVEYFSVRGPHESLAVVGESVVETFLTNPFEGLNLLENDWGGLPEQAACWPEFVTPTWYVPLSAEAAELARSVPREASVAQYLIDLSARLYAMLAYDPDVTHVHSTADDALRERAGVCQDFAHLMLACARTQGIPSRYVSGCLYTGDEAGMRGENATHAWVDCLLPGGRWLSLDPTNNLLASERHVRVHLGRDYADAAPLRGIYNGPPARSLEVSVAVTEVAPSLTGS